LKNAAS
jgi:dynein heavy chain